MKKGFIKSSFKKLFFLFFLWFSILKLNRRPIFVLIRSRIWPYLWADRSIPRFPTADRFILRFLAVYDRSMSRFPAVDRSIPRFCTSFQSMSQSNHTSNSCSRSVHILPIFQIFWATPYIRLQQAIKPTSQEREGPLDSAFNVDRSSSSGSTFQADNSPGNSRHLPLFFSLYSFTIFVGDNFSMKKTKRKEQALHRHCLPLKARLFIMQRFNVPRLSTITTIERWLIVGPSPRTLLLVNSCRVIASRLCTCIVRSILYLASSYLADAKLPATRSNRLGDAGRYGRIKELRHDLHRLRSNERAGERGEGRKGVVLDCCATSQSLLYWRMSQVINESAGANRQTRRVFWILRSEVVQANAYHQGSSYSLLYS